MKFLPPCLINSTGFVAIVPIVAIVAIVAITTYYFYHSYLKRSFTVVINFDFARCG